MVFGVFGEIINAFNKNHGSTYDINPYTDFKGKYLILAQRESPSAGVDWRSHYDTFKVFGSAEVDDYKVYEILLKEKDLHAVTTYIDTITGDIVKLKAKL